MTTDCQVFEFKAPAATNYLMMEKIKEVRRIKQYWDFRERSLRAVTALKDHTTALNDHRGALNDPQVLEFQCKTHPQN